MAKFVHSNIMEIQHIEKLLNRNWFVDAEDVNELIHQISEDTFVYIYNNRQKYPEFIHHCIEPMDSVPRNPGKMRLSSMTEADMLTEKKASSKAFDTEVDAKWLAYKLLHKLERPANSYDTELDDAFAELQLRKKDLTRKVYSRGKNDHNKELELAVEVAETNYNNALETVAIQDEFWDGRSKFNWFNKHMLSM